MTLQELKEATWKPIETAPTDKDVLIYDPEQGVKKASSHFGRWSCLDGFCGGYSCCPEEYKPTHWMDLPDAP